MENKNEEEQDNSLGFMKLVMYMFFILIALLVLSDTLDVIQGNDEISDKDYMDLNRMLVEHPSLKDDNAEYFKDKKINLSEYGDIKKQYLEKVKATVF